MNDQLRRGLAIVHLHTSPVPLATLAGDLGFANCAAFQHAFKTWAGSAPGAYRARTVRDGASTAEAGTLTINLEDDPHDPT